MFFVFPEQAAVIRADLWILSEKNNQPELTLSDFTTTHLTLIRLVTWTLQLCLSLLGHTCCLQRILPLDPVCLCWKRMAVVKDSVTVWGLLSKENMLWLIFNGCSCHRINQYEPEMFRENQTAQTMCQWFLFKTPSIIYSLLRWKKKHTSVHLYKNIFYTMCELVLSQKESAAFADLFWDTCDKQSTLKDLEHWRQNRKHNIIRTKSSNLYL